ncbi:hypothetical protein ABKN59_007283 [Abortiporus biennis]
MLSCDGPRGLTSGRKPFICSQSLAIYHYPPVCFRQASLAIRLTRPDCFGSTSIQKNFKASVASSSNTDDRRLSLSVKFLTNLIPQLISSEMSIPKPISEDNIPAPVMVLLNKLSKSQASKCSGCSYTMRIPLRHSS